ncbi:hypothetical protein BDV28DRAFT_145389 [Aspergillus coremiiformis]|uniref:Cyanovirin-N domain-containing protein n=1 Tax=Aspergillus coremiiformis TaxID=138285 RepID=A0A5N6ZEV3_9EURO|nr:hypothetical protein BDV28DRAFT_145389 [Aspergillus coremiiformis]
MHYPTLSLLATAYLAALATSTEITERGLRQFPGERQFLINSCDVEVLDVARASPTAPPPPQLLIARCKNNNGEEVRSSLNLNRCLGWDATEHKFTPQRDGNGLTRTNGDCANCLFGPHAQSPTPNLICYCANVPMADRRRVVPPGISAALKTFNMDSVLKLGNGGLIECHGIPATLIPRRPAD